MAAEDTADETPAVDTPVARLPTRAFAIAWAVFWTLMATIAIQDHLRQGHADWWKPLLWEGSSFVVASVMAALHAPWILRTDRLLARPAHWFAANLLPLLPAAPVFVVLVYGIRHGAYAALGLRYEHEPWPIVLRYEALKFALFYALFVAVLFGMRSFAALGASRLRAERARTLLQQAQSLQLTQQLEPHFLFNALNTIAATVHTDPQRADALLTRLAALLRAATDLARRPEIALDEELRLLEAYGEIMRERFADRVALSFDVDAGARRCLVPALVLQPLLENAFLHAVEPRAERTAVHVRAHVAEGRLRLEVADDGGAWPSTPAFGVGLSNLQQRLALRYGAHATLQVEGAPAGRGVRARIELPCES